MTFKGLFQVKQSYDSKYFFFMGIMRKIAFFLGGTEKSPASYCTQQNYKQNRKQDASGTLSSLYHIYLF